VTSQASGLRLAIDGAVATVSLGRPERRNAMTPAVWHDLAEMGASMPAEVRVVVVRGDGPSFCAGIDLSLLSSGGSGGNGGSSPEAALAATAGDEPIANPADQDFEQKVASYQAGYLWLRDPSIVSIAAVQGHAIGAGFQLALACDLRILTEDAKLCMKEPALGLVPDLTGTKPLVDLVGLPRAIELCLTARTVGAAEALLLGLAELVVPGAELDAAVADLVAALLAIDPAAARATKALLQQAPGNTLAGQVAAERRAQTDLLKSRLAPRP
jgi:enoyl-CoA hydratase/carnithine racemase